MDKDKVYAIREGRQYWTGLGWGDREGRATYSAVELPPVVDGLELVREDKPDHCVYIDPDMPEVPYALVIRTEPNTGPVPCSFCGGEGEVSREKNEAVVAVLKAARELDKRGQVSIAMRVALRRLDKCTK